MSALTVNGIAISLAICMLIRTEMLNRDAYFTLLPVRPYKDKQARATKIIHMTSQGKVFFKVGMTELEDELLAFPTGDHDDIVDTLANAALYMQKAVSASRGEIVSEYNPLEREI